MAANELTKHVRIATPCTANWDEMTGDDKVRYCGQCHLNVYNSAAMTDEEVLRTLSGIAQGKRVCMRIYRRQDGTILTKDCPIGVRKLQENLRRAAAFIAGGLSLFLSLPVFAQKPSVTICKSVGAASEEGNGGAKKKPVWHSKIQGTEAATQTKPLAAPTPTAPLNTAGSSRELMGDVAIDPRALAGEMRIRVKEAERAHGTSSSQTATALMMLHQQLAMIRSTDLVEADSVARRAIDIFVREKQYDVASQICNTQLAAIRRFNKADQLKYWEGRAADLAALAGKAHETTAPVKKPH